MPLTQTLNPLEGTLEQHIDLFSTPLKNPLIPQSPKPEIPNPLRNPLPKGSKYHNIYIYIYIYMYMYVYIYICMYVYIYIVAT